MPSPLLPMPSSRVDWKLANPAAGRKHVFPASRSALSEGTSVRAAPTILSETGVERRLCRLAKTTNLSRWHPRLSTGQAQHPQWIWL